MPNPNLPINARYNTYIGTRYVPKFADPTEWSNQQTYEPLTIVTYQGNSYTSKTFVPVGVDILNTTYWAETGSYNAQVEVYRQEVNTLKSELSPETLGSRKYIFISDSYGDPVAVGGTPWYNTVVSQMGLSEGDYYTGYQGGAGFYTTYGALFENIMKPGVTPHSIPNIQDKSSITDIVIVGGFNDRSSPYASIMSAIQSFMEFVNTNYTNAKVWLVGCGWSFNYTFVELFGNCVQMSAYQNCGKYGMIWCENSQYIMRGAGRFNPEPDSSLPEGFQYVHPSATGSQAIADFVCGILAYGRPETSQQYVVVNSPFLGSIHNTGGGTNFITAQAQINDKILCVIATQNIVVNSTPVNGKLELATINGGFVCGGTDSKIYIPITAIITNTESQRVNTSGCIVVESGKFTLWTPYDQQIQNLSIQRGCAYLPAQFC